MNVQFIVYCLIKFGENFAQLTSQTKKTKLEQSLSKYSYLCPDYSDKQFRRKTIYNLSNLQNNDSRNFYIIFLYSLTDFGTEFWFISTQSCV